MRKALMVWIIFTGIVLSAPPAWAEVRGVVLVLTSDKEQGTLLTIHSDEKSEKQKEIPLDDALKIVRRMTGWGSVVAVYIVADDGVDFMTAEGRSLGNLRKLLEAVDTNPWLSLACLRIGQAKSGDDTVQRVIQATDK